LRKFQEKFPKMGKCAKVYKTKNWKIKTTYPPDHFVELLEYNQWKLSNCSFLKQYFFRKKLCTTWEWSIMFLNPHDHAMLLEQINFMHVSS
jgi:hypothetical protein